MSYVRVMIDRNQRISLSASAFFFLTHASLRHGELLPKQKVQRRRKSAMPKLCVEYSKSGRAKCSNTSCGKKIEKHELRIGTEVIMPFSEEGVESWKWRHLCCFTERQLSNARSSGDIDAIQGEGDLAPADKALVQKMREGRLVGDTSILGRIGDIAHSAVSEELKGKGSKATKPKAKASGSADDGGLPSASAGEKRPPAPPRKTKIPNTKKQDDDADSEATEEYEVAVEAVTGKPKCPYGAHCFRTTEEHFRQYTHGDDNGTAADAAVPSDHSSAKLKPVIKRRKL
ncbi:hypothetical protein, conserved [Leishmania donovani]|uniref:Poly(ADP-ribose) polymerase and DNA-Ligase Zn-finger region/Zinc-finger (CX5CX6HX5H) motif containing protein, putative n=1 Tax=Leishmania donovani TaxID=5661 RepID=E9BTJ9_LEIDO|nr:hypothetical protein, conserved [Leishmania donovani]AYU83485.1 Poly(ADP-ribose) polymerase and DNA-Ligase Zn-finger region/Zinc-finger (CX5CX6HX5H) motif containing protein, putative [Leishmania donovani]CBZ38578.1 hypothetical protein, conserved [Leishmania donovani]